MESCSGGLGFVKWEEHFISQEKGNRVVHYYFKDSAGNSVLAVIGTERSIRHMVYVVPEEFSRVHGFDSSGSTCFKWRSRREVVNWLTSLLSKKNALQDCSSISPSKLKKNDPADNFVDASITESVEAEVPFTRKLTGHDFDIVWLGSAWACPKQLKHYHAFSRNGTMIPIHSFVFVMAQDGHYVAYLEDMYEDKKGQKKVRVRWFHQYQEVVDRIHIPLPAPHPKEVFITQYVQVISAECVDGFATVLTPEHFENCLATIPYAVSARIHLCYRQIRNSKVKPFKLSQLKGYFDQTILCSLDLYTSFGEKNNGYEDCSPGGRNMLKHCEKHQMSGVSHSSSDLSGHMLHSSSCGPQHPFLGFKASFSVKYADACEDALPPFKVNGKIEVLCQDSGIRGCWFRCTIIDICQKWLKVFYDDLHNEDGCGNLEEWIPAVRAAAPDKLEMRCLGRLMVRPYPPTDPNENSRDVVYTVGIAVDAWWNDGWWEGVVTGVDNFGDDALQVYFPSEEIFSVVERRHLRVSRDWFKNSWVEVEAKQDILSVILAANPCMKLYSLTRCTESGGSAISARDDYNSERDSFDEEKNTEAAGYSSTKKRPRECGQSFEAEENADIIPDCSDHVISHPMLLISGMAPRCLR